MYESSIYAGADITRLFSPKQNVDVGGVSSVEEEAGAEEDAGVVFDTVFERDDVEDTVMIGERNDEDASEFMMACYVSDRKLHSSLVIRYDCVAGPPVDGQQSDDGVTGVRDVQEDDDAGFRRKRQKKGRAGPKPPKAKTAARPKAKGAARSKLPKAKAVAIPEAVHATQR